MTNLFDQFDVALLLDAALELDRLHPFRFRLERFIDRFVDFHQTQAVGDRNPLAKRPPSN